MNYRPIDIARKLNISTSLLRHYEKNELFPAPKRSKSGYRMYSETSFLYIQAVRTATLAYGYRTTKQLMEFIRQKEYSKMLWLINQEQYQLHQQKEISTQTLALLHEEESDLITQMPRKGWITIGEAAERLSITETTIRHWTKEGLLEVTRDKESNYRKFDEQALRQLLIIRLIRASTWSLDVVRDILATFKADSPAEMIQLAEEALLMLNIRLERAFISQRYLYQLIAFLSPDYFTDFPGMEFYDFERPERN
ncbi:MerR family DNA-binding transcriptional regulator [Enterococcus sp. BWR-S5]|uniref:MerR family DNA-binding transcriptional regulator n=1 Tax=Enterococcus sp. BWR-S5 TaxID=2787714 RepID=UPI001921AA39|nr:MerR family DNA-binding transcriptional regulator [Enterococcus sp. BWR-S5]MBL1224876.1 MerR family DNA-binding transcriptional regulator [Enterococcus sp. BWR-S5]